MDCFLAFRLSSNQNQKKTFSITRYKIFLYFDSHSFPIQNNFMPSHTMYNMVVLNLIDGNVNEIIRK